VARWDKPGTGPGLGGGQGPAQKLMSGVVGSAPIYGSDPTTAGVTGFSNTGPGVLGQSIGRFEWDPPLPGSGLSDGVQGESDGNGVHGISHGPTASGVWGESKGGGNGVSGSTSSTFQPGPDVTAAVYGQNYGTGPGVKGASSGGDGVLGYSGSSNHAGVSANNDSGGPGIWATGSPAGHFEGQVQILGDLTVENITGAKVTCLNGLSAVGGFSLHGDATISGDIFLPGADCAEQFDIGGTKELTPGTVVVIDHDGTLRESRGAYDKKVAGVISGAGGYRPGIVLDKRPSGEQRAPVALVGKVCCKVDAEYAPIEVGDLLTTSPTPGHAMKAAQPLRAFGSVIGKALRGLEAGQGLIPVLIALQ
jgi:hypothetical protein